MPDDVDDAHIQSLFADTDRVICPARARRLASQLRGTADLRRAIDQASNDHADEAHADLLLYDRARRDGADPARLVRRLKAEADALDVRAAAHDDQAAEWFGKSAYRRGAGDTALAEDLRRRAEAAESVAGDLRDRAFAKRLLTARIEMRSTATAALCALAAPLSA